MLNSPKLVEVAKAIDLGSAHDRVLHAARIVSDVRPLFDESRDTKPLGSNLVHTLQLTTFGTIGAEDLFVTLDADDLKTLRRHIDRALSKAAQLEEALAGTSLHLVDKDRSST